MQSEKVNVCSAILDKSPKACINHCCSHNLYFSIAQCTNIQVINIIKEQYKTLQIFFQTSPKRKSLLEHIVSLRLHDICQQKVLIGIGSTLWSERGVSYEYFYLAIPHMIEAFEVMNDTHLGYPATKGEAKSKKANLFLIILTDFEFIVGIITLYCLMHAIPAITQQHQKRAVDVLNPYTEGKNCISDLVYLCNSIKTSSQNL